MLNSLNTNISNDARLYRLPLGATKPTTATQLLPVGTEDFGLFALEGETWGQSVTTETIKARQKQVAVRQVVQDELKSLAVNAMEDKKLIRECYHGGTETNAGVLTMDGFKLTERVYVYDSIDDGVGYEKNIRIVFTATVTPNGDLTFVPGALVLYPLLFTITKATRISEANGSVTPEPEPEPSEYPQLTGLDANYSLGSETMTVAWNSPDFTGGEEVEYFKVELHDGEGAGLFVEELVTGSELMIDIPSVPSGANWEIWVSYSVLGGTGEYFGTAILPSVAS